MDIANGIFELVGGLMLAMNVRQLYIDKCLRGTTPYPIAFFTAWGIFNLFFYPANGLWLSLAGGCVVVAINCVWLYLYMKYVGWDYLFEYLDDCLGLTGVGGPVGSPEDEQSDDWPCQLPPSI